MTTYEQRQGQVPRTLRMNPKESAMLYNLLCDNARVWNAGLREQLRQQVSSTEAFNARANPE